MWGYPTLVFHLSLQNYNNYLRNCYEEVSKYAIAAPWKNKSIDFQMLLPLQGVLLAYPYPQGAALGYVL